MSEKYKYKCKISGKRVFESHSEAKGTMLAFTIRIRLKYQGRRRKHRQGKPAAKRVYLCPFCRGYHITKAVYFREDQEKIAKKLVEAKEKKFTKLVNRRLLKEHWKPITFDADLTSPYRYEVSDRGRVRSFSKVSGKRILKGALIRGYRIIRLKLYQPKDPETRQIFKELKKEIYDLYKKRIEKIVKNHYAGSIDRTTKQIEKKRRELRQKMVLSLQKRTVNHYFLIHKMVAKYFLPEPKSEETVVAHLDFDKLNNRATNLKWITPEKNKKHQSNKAPLSGITPL